MVLDSLISVFVVIAIGWALRQKALPAEADWQGFEKISYYVLVPVLIAKTLMSAKLGDVPFARLGTALVGTIGILGIALLVLRKPLERWLRVDPPAFTSLFQGVMRWNAFIALAISANLYGREGVTLAAVAIAALIPILNVATVMILRRYGTGGGSLMRGLATNPFILGTLGGLALNMLAIPLPRALSLSLDIIGQCALGTGLILVGAGLRLQDLQRPSPALLLAVGIRLLIAPAIAYGLARLLGLQGAQLAVVVLCLGVPTATASYLLARRMGGDAPLMAAITTAQTIVSMITLPLILAALT
ncbi:MAG: AEC family transporter [Beijerinckiaceae bacterium]|nr:AEC family transporter [Beijerinckiaceae bacterium]MCZ8299596.1 AEC family transporter [Beijerinckiaceae bacterium]